MVQERGRRVITTNRRAHHNYVILETVEAGIALLGTEVKSMRLGRASLVDAFATIDDDEAYLRGLHIAEYGYGSWTNHVPRRTRKLLLHRKEIGHLDVRVRESGLSLVPLSLYFTDGKVKVELALARGKKTWDKRQALAARDAQREMTRGIGWQAKGRTDTAGTRAGRRRAW